MLIQEILKDQNDFSQSEKQIADYFLREKDRIRKQGIRTISKNCYAAASSVVRFCQKIGFAGLDEFKEEYLQELDYYAKHFQDIDPNRPFEKDDDELAAAGKIAALYHETVQDTLSLLDADTLKKAATILDKETVYILTLSSTVGICKSFREKMMKIGRRVIILEDRRGMEYEIINADKKNSVFLFLSYTGESEQIVAYASEAVKAGMSCAAVTSYGINRLSEIIPCSIRVSSKEKLVSSLGSFSFSISTLYILDVLYAELFRLDYDRNRQRKKAASQRESSPFYISKGRKSSNSSLNE